MCIITQTLCGGPVIAACVAPWLYATQILYQSYKLGNSLAKNGRTAKTGVLAQFRSWKAQGFHGHVHYACSVAFVAKNSSEQRMLVVSKKCKMDEELYCELLTRSKGSGKLTAAEIVYDPIDLHSFVFKEHFAEHFKAFGTLSSFLLFNWTYCGLLIFALCAIALGSYVFGLYAFLLSVALLLFCSSLCFCLHKSEKSQVSVRPTHLHRPTLAVLLSNGSEKEDEDFDSISPTSSSLPLISAEPMTTTDKKKVKTERQSKKEEKKEKSTEVKLLTLISKLKASKDAELRRKGQALAARFEASPKCVIGEIQVLVASGVKSKRQLAERLAVDSAAVDSYCGSHKAEESIEEQTAAIRPLLGGIPEDCECSDRSSQENVVLDLGESATE